MNRYMLIGAAVAVLVFLGSLLAALAGDGSIGPAGLSVRIIGAGLAGFAVVLLLRNFGPD